MLKAHIEVDIFDDQWPNIKLVSKRFENGIIKQVRESTLQYDIASTGFEPIPRDQIRMAIDSIIKEHKPKPNQT